MFIQKLSNYLKNKKESIFLIFFIICCFIIAHFLYLIIPGLFVVWNNQISDQLYQLRYQIKGKEKVSPYLINVCIDDRSIRKLDLSIWDRSVYSDLIDLLNKGGAHSIAVDILFEDNLNETDDINLVKITKEGNVYFPVIPKPIYYGKLETKQEFDSIQEEILQENIWYPKVIKEGDPPEANFAYMPFKSLSSAASGLGHVTCMADLDGLNRRFPLFFKYNNGYIPSLSLRMVCDYLNITDKNIHISFGEHVILKNAEVYDGLFKDIAIPIDNRGRIIINYIGPWDDSFYHFLSYKLLAKTDRVEIIADLKNEIADSLVMISDITTRNKDFQIGLFNKIFPQSGIQLTIANSILTDNFIYEPSIFEIIFIIIILIALLCFFAIRFKAVQFTLSTIGLFVFFLFMSVLLFVFFGKMYTIIPIILSFLLCLIGVDIYSYIIEERKKEIAIIRNKELEELDKKKTEFYHNITHEFKDPITLIRYCLTGNLEAGNIKDKNHPYYKNMIKQCDKILNLVDNFLTDYKFESGWKDLKKQKYNMTRLLSYYTAELESRAKLKGIELRYVYEKNGGILGEIDKQLFESAFFNLISNAFKFTDTGGKIEIQLQKNNSVKEYYISVSDTGKGIESDKIDKVFDRFYSENGTGIGLSLAREIISLHKGDITVESKIGKGSVFTIKLPLVKTSNEKCDDKIDDFTIEKPYNLPQVDDKIEDNQSYYSNNRKLILILDDNKEMINHYISILQKDYNVKWALNGFEGLQLIEKIPRPDLILSDIVMPEMDGKEFYNKLLEKKEYKDIPIIFVSGKSEEEQINVLKPGAIDIIRKPFNTEVLEYKIRNLLKRETNLGKYLVDKMTSMFNDFLKGNIKVCHMSWEVSKDIILKYSLTKNEVSIIECLALGNDDMTIANKLDKNVRAIQNTLSNVYKKLGVNSRTEVLSKIYIVKN